MRVDKGINYNRYIEFSDENGIDIVFALVDKGSALFSLLLFQVKVVK
jgi:hypothetical protein